MKNYINGLLAVLLSFLFFLSCQSKLLVISPETLSSEPTAYPTVQKEPNPLLMGMFTGRRMYTLTGHRNPIDRGITYWLGKKNDKYAVYLKLTFNSSQSSDSLSTWGGDKRECTINGDEIRFHSSMRVFISEGKVYYEAPDLELRPFQLTKIE